VKSLGLARVKRKTRSVAQKDFETGRKWGGIGLDGGRRGMGNSKN